MIATIKLYITYTQNQSYILIIIKMNRGIISALSAFTVVTGTVAYYFWKKVGSRNIQFIDRLTVKKILIKLRKRAYSTLREIAFIVNNIRTLEGDLEVKKISEIFMRDGGSGEKKLHSIQSLVLTEEGISQKDFEYSCNQYCQNDIQIKILLETFRKDLNMALEGVIQTYHGPLPRLEPQRVVKIQQQIIKRRMQIIHKKYLNKSSSEQCLQLESQIQEYLALQGIKHEKEPNQKVFMSLLEHYYRTNTDFKEQFEQLEMDMELFIIEMEYKSKQMNQNQQLQKIEQCKSVQQVMGNIIKQRDIQKVNGRNQQENGQNLSLHLEINKKERL